MVLANINKTIFLSEKEVSGDTRHGLKPFRPSNKHFSEVKRDKNVKFAQNFLKLFLWFLTATPLRSLEKR